MKKLILASKSPRRISLLTDMGVEFSTDVADIDETVFDNLKPIEQVKNLAFEKAKFVANRHSDENIIVAADTLVELNGKALGKPKDQDEAFDMLSSLSETLHYVHTGISVIEGDKKVLDVETTAVKFRKLSDDEIWHYIKTGEPFDKAGGYGIQEKGGIFVEKIDGDYFNVMGLPLCKLYLILNNSFNYNMIF